MTIYAVNAVSIGAIHEYDMKADGDTWDLERLQGMTLMTRIACKNRFDVLLLLLKKTFSNMFEFKDVLGPDAYGNTCLH